MGKHKGLLLRASSSKPGGAFHVLAISWHGLGVPHVVSFGLGGLIGL